MTEMLGRRFDGLQIVERLAESDGEGPDSSQVYLAVRTAGGDSLVVKVFSRSASAPDSLTSLKRGLLAASHLDDDRIPTLLGSGAIDGRPYILLPYSAGASLSSRLKLGTANFLDPIHLLTDLAESLGNAHRHGVHHGTIDPSQLLFDEETGDVRLIGVGQSSVRSTGHEDEWSVYRAPEVAGGRSGSAASDQYSFGVLALELLSGLDPGQALPLLHTPRPISQKAEAATLRLDPRAVIVLKKATAAQPEQRFGSIEETSRALRIALGDLQPVVDAPPEPRAKKRVPRRGRRQLALVAIVLLLLGVVGVVPAFSAGLISLPDWTTLALAPPSATPDPGARAGAAALSSPTSDSDQPGIVLPTIGPTPTAGSMAAVEPTNTSVALAASGSAPTATALPTATVAGPIPAPTKAPTAAPAKPVSPTATSVPPTAAPPTAVPPTLNPKKCKSDPTHPNYCTPTP